VELYILSPVERLQLVNQYKILEKLDAENEKHYASLREILEEGISIFYEKVFDDIYPQIAIEKCLLVQQVVEMFNALQYGFEKLIDKSGLDERDVLFYGFDVHDRDEWHFAEYWKRAGGMWQKILKMGPDSNLNVRRDHYAKMVERWFVIKYKYKDKEKWKLTKEEIKAIVADDNVPE